MAAELAYEDKENFVRITKDITVFAEETYCVFRLHGFKLTREDKDRALRILSALYDKELEALDIARGVTVV